MIEWLVNTLGLLLGRKRSEGTKHVLSAEPTKQLSMSLILPSKKNIHLQLIRKVSNDTCILGELTCIEEPTLILTTLEPPKREAKPRSIPCGTYDVTLYQSPHLGYKVALLHGVDGFSEVEIHKGNYPRDTKGCVLVGLKIDGNMVVHSKLAFDLLMGVLASADKITIAVA